MNTKKPQVQTMQVETPLGTLIAKASGDATYPGISICFAQEDDEDKYEKQLALAEVTSETIIYGLHSLRLMVWNSDHEDYSDDFTFMQDFAKELKEIEAVLHGNPKTEEARDDQGSSQNN